jgi:3-hydroxyacyl-CoA dehydrogenase/enoyl-CoA hydratase/3-hydroxybutyryl-CoA epimerase/enoyl-CoA isomerase
MLDDGIAELTFDLKDESVNKFNQATVLELGEAVAQLQAAPDIRGLLVTSAKDCFIVGADVTEFLGLFRLSEDELVQGLQAVHRLFCAVEDLPFPSVTAINGYALGGGLEFTLTTCYRVMAANTRVGLPETKLGIFPGWGGTMRLSRLAGADNAIEWIASGEQYGSDVALRNGVVDAVVAPEKLREAALDLLAQAIAGKRDWKARQTGKNSPLLLNPTEAMMVFEGAKAFVAAKAGPNYPSPVAAIEVMQKGAFRSREDALAIEADAFARMARTPTAASLVSIFLGEQYVGKVAKGMAKSGDKVRQAAVVGAGIMGGGVAYQSASKGTPIIMKDIAEGAIALGLAEAGKLLAKRVERGRMTALDMAASLSKIRSTLCYGDFKGVDLVVEAVVENEKVKESVLVELEDQVREDTVLTSNTSTISITRLAEGLKRPENFCGMHFFNPVHRMPLVEVIRGRKSGDRAVATAVGYALAMGKTPIVVNDCAGFLVNRILSPYFAGFFKLVNEGVDFQRIDRVMEMFGWPMGPAYLLDVVGIDTAHHAGAVMAREFPDRMANEGRTALDVMYELKRFGQKNGKGFYGYAPDKKGAPAKAVDPEAAPLLRELATVDNSAAISDQDILDRMMLPMIIECSRCLEDQIAASPVEVDIGLVYGLGFPPFRGGALRYADQVGLEALCGKAGKFKALGKLYEPTAQMRTYAGSGSTFHKAR